MKLIQILIKLVFFIFRIKLTEIQLLFFCFILFIFRFLVVHSFVISLQNGRILWKLCQSFLIDTDIPWHTMPILFTYDTDNKQMFVSTAFSSAVKDNRFFTFGWGGSSEAFMIHCYVTFNQSNFVNSLNYFERKKMF